MVRSDMPAHPVRRYATITFARGAVVSLFITLCAGMLGVLYYVPLTRPHMMEAGLSFQSLRPIHTTFASAWIFLGGVSIVHRYLQDIAGPPSSAERFRLRLQVFLWAAAGVGVLGSLAMGIYSGREYMGFHPVISIAILGGWLLFAWNFFAATWRGFWSRPVYVTMWGAGVLFFIYTFIEQHAWLLPGVFAEPVVDLRLQWKSCGTLVGSFNLFVYGALYYVGTRITGDERYAHSKLAYALFAVGLLNSFTNYGHHTFHIPQSELVKWVAFVVSMTEIAILARVMWDIAGHAKRRATGPFLATSFFLNAARWWTLGMLVTAIFISIPPLNSIIHGTQVVTAHAMGAEIGIDSMALFAVVCFLLGERLLGGNGGGGVEAGSPVNSPLNSAGMRRAAIGLNVCVATLVIWLHISGSIVGYMRYLDLLPPEWLQLSSAYVFAGAGIGAATCLLFLLARWSRLLFEPVEGEDDESREVSDVTRLKD